MFPDWVIAQKKQGCEIKCIRGQYYMYRLKSRWDPKRKKAKKVSGEYLGKVTEGGIVPPRRKSMMDSIDSIPVYSLEFGATALILSLTGDILTALQKHFGDNGDARRIFVIAMLRLVSSPSCPFCRVGNHYETSWMSKVFPGLALSPASLTELSSRVGGNRRACAAFMRETRGTAPYYLIDGTRTPSSSRGMTLAEVGYSSRRDFLPQINQIYLVALTEGGKGVPAFYRNVPGNIPDVTALKLTLEDAEVNEGGTFLGDAGFASRDNFLLLSESNMNYIVPLRRNSSEIKLDQITFTDVFSHHHRTILAKSEERKDYRLCIFRDEKLRSDEMTDFVERAEKANATIKAKRTFEENELHNVSTETMDRVTEFGTIILRTSLLDTPLQKIYEAYKLRWEIEQMFDSMRNDLGNDASYRQDDRGFEAWSFIGHITLLVACRILALLREKKLSKQWSLRGILDSLSRLQAVQIADKWKIAETTRRTRELIGKLGFGLSLESYYIPKG